MADRNFQKKKRNDIKRKRKPVMLITAEGRNKTEKIQLVKELQKNSKNIRFIVSNPCIEVWFILHFIYTTHQFKDSKEPKKELAKYIPSDEESMDISDIIRPMIEDAKKHTEQLKGYYETLGIAWGDAECNPMTDVVEVLEELEIL